MDGSIRWTNPDSSAVVFDVHQTNVTVELLVALVF